MDSVVSKTVKACMAVIIALALLLPVFTLNANAMDQDKLESGTASVVIYFENLELKNLNTMREVSCDTLIVPLGTGFFVGEGKDITEYIVTGDYVFEIYDYLLNFLEETDDLLAIYENVELRAYYSDDEYSALDLECRGSEEKNTIDLAVFSLDEPIAQARPLKISAAPKKGGDEITVYSAGYPEKGSYEYFFDYFIDLVNDNRSEISNFSVHKGKLDTYSFETDAIPASIGCYGGPIVNEKNEIVSANCYFGFGDDGVLTDSISSAEIIEFLDNNNIPYKKAGGIAIVVVIIICVIVAAAAVVAVIFMKNKGIFSNLAPKPKQSAPAPAAPPANAFAAAQPQMFVRSMSAQHNGKTFPVGAEPLLIGRDPSRCTIVYQEGTQGVSAVHCSISYDPATNTFILTDLGSTYGTYLIGGQRVLEKTSLRLRSGDSFYVGDKSNVCRVEVMGR